MHACTRCGNIPAVMREYFATGIDRHCARALCHRRHAHPDPGRLSRPQTPQISRHDSARQSAGDAMPVSAPASLQVMRCPLPLPHLHVFLIRIAGFVRGSIEPHCDQYRSTEPTSAPGAVGTRADDMRAKHHTHMRIAMMVYDMMHVVDQFCKEELN
jgi:hypothetical protein